MGKIHLLFFLLLTTTAHAQNLAPLTVEKIMRDPAQWIGTSPSDVQWSEDSQTVYFKWNPDRNRTDSLYAVRLTDPPPRKVEPARRRALPAFAGTYNRARTQKTYEKNGDVFWLDTKTGKIRPVTNTVEAETNPVFSHDEKRILFTREDNLFAWNPGTGETSQLTDFRKGAKKADAKGSEQDQWLKADQRRWVGVVKERSDQKKAGEKISQADLPRRPKAIYLEEKTVANAVLSPDERYLTYRLTLAAKGNQTAVVPSYVTESGYTADLPARPKVGNRLPTEELFVYDRGRDTVFAVSTRDLPGISDPPDYPKDYPQKAASSRKDTAAKGSVVRKVRFFGPVQWSEDGQHAAVVIRADDNKDRWIALLDVATHSLKSLDRYRDEAWVGGPGSLAFGWLPDNRVWFQSEASGYAHLYTVEAATGRKQPLTSGKFEVSDVQCSRDGKHLYFLANEVHPGEKHLYRMPATGGPPTRLTPGTGAYEYKLSPDEKYVALRHSTSTQPWELHWMENKPNAKPLQLTQSLTEEFKSYPWREPEVITFPARDGVPVHARLYQPEAARKNGAAVIFVHGAGYLQNAHKWWSQYFREYTFHNLLVDRGFTVLDVDYRGSAGYGRDWRTGIYRHMGGKDLSDHVDGAKLLVDKYGVDAGRIGLYGGSYGGFITLMAMFTTPDVFAAGAALRPVTDWAHYNHPYTANILNEPATDSLAYARSSPLYYAEGLKGPLLMCHGMVDVNVHFQDVVRLTQRLIELKKDNWELAVYPMEDHAFVESSSWTDEYKRILKLFEERLGKNGNGVK
ncbi:MAG: prolyl oligopeptidase family serine peptidase [Ferruginibacter sp.]|nr:prolyl oligopeptidase family serine peptidase [Cytophagales bacterium]